MAAVERIAANETTAAAETKPAIARFYCEHIVPTAAGLLPSVLAPAAALFELDETQLIG